MNQSELQQFIDTFFIIFEKDPDVDEGSPQLDIQPSNWGEALLGAMLSQVSIAGNTFGEERRLIEVPDGIELSFPIHSSPRRDEGFAVYYGEKPEPVGTPTCDLRNGLAIFHRTFRLKAPSVIAVAEHFISFGAGSLAQDKVLYLQVGSGFEQAVQEKSLKAWQDAQVVLKRIQQVFKNTEMNQGDLFLNLMLLLMKKEPRDDFQLPLFLPETVMPDVAFLAEQLDCLSEAIYSPKHEE